MTDKQYADMTTIMMFCRHFADQMYKCMENAGLNEKGFELNIRVGNRELFSGKTEKCDICFEQSILDVDRATYYKNRMEQRRMIGGGWFVDDDPRAEEGSVPPMVVEVKATAKDVSKGTGSNSSKPYPVDGTWFSVYDDPPYVGGGQ